MFGLHYRNQQRLRLVFSSLPTFTMKPASAPSTPASPARRAFLRNMLIGTAGLTLAPRLIRAADLAAKTAGGPANARINIVQIGAGRQGAADMLGVIAHPLCRVVGVCDLDAKRLETARQTVADFYKKKGEAAVDIATWRDYREVLARPDVDAVVVSVPDHWHAQVAIEAALAGKNLYVQKPVTYGIAEAIALRETVRAKKVVLQTGSQQRSSRPYFAFRPASEAVRNGRLGRVRTVKIGIGLDAPKGVAPAPMPVPANLDYERWLGPAPQQPYMEDRVHSQKPPGARGGYGRPGWITTEDFGLGMITNWGAHHIDIMLWALGLELSGPTAIDARAEFMKNDVWTVHTAYHVEMQMPNPDRTQVIMDDKFENGLLFEGDEGAVFCSRGKGKPTSTDGSRSTDPSALRASHDAIRAPLTSDAVRWMPSPNHYLNWLEAIKGGHAPIAPIEQSARSLEACAASWIGMKLGRKLAWDPAAEKFVNDAEANAMLFRAPRKPEYDITRIVKAAGIA